MVADTIAFNAVLTEYDALEGDQPVVWNQVMVNLGDG